MECCLRILLDKSGTSKVFRMKNNYFLIFLKGSVKVVYIENVYEGILERLNHIRHSKPLQNIYTNLATTTIKMYIQFGFSSLDRYYFVQL